MYAITKTVKKHRLIEVKQLQALLHMLGQPISVDGMLGDETKQAIKHFQQNHHLDSDKAVTRDTWLILYQVFSDFMDKLSNGSQSLDTRSRQLLNIEPSFFINLDQQITNPKMVIWLQVLLYLLDNNTRITGVFDAITAEKIKEIQQKHYLNEDKDGVVNDVTWQALFNEGANTANIVANLFLTEDYIQHKAEQEGLTIATLKALIKVESTGSGFYSECRPKMLFEGHKFWRQIEQQGIDATQLQEKNKDILYPQWSTSFYTGSGQGEYDRLKRAKRIDEEAALNAASWGMFHIMGVNAKASGFDNVTDFVSSLSKGEGYQLDAFIAFLKHEELIQFLKEQDWATFARRYNGVQFRSNKYDPKLQIAFDITQQRTCSTRDKAADTLVIKEYTRWLEEAFSEFAELAEQKEATV